MPKQLKRSLTISEEIERLKNVHNLNIKDNTMAEKILSRVNYYTLRGYGEYGKLFDEEASMKSGNYKFLPSVTIEHLYKLYLFDCELRSKILKLIGYIEKNVKITISLSITNYELVVGNPRTRLGPEGHLNKLAFGSNKKCKRLKKIFDYLLTTLTTSESYMNDDVIKHHINMYGSRFPLWVIIEYLEIGKLYKLFESLNGHIKTRILKQYNLTNDDFTNYLGIIWHTRNKCAHFNRLYGKNIYYLVKQNANPIVSKGMFHPVYEVLCIIKHFLQCIDMEDKWKLFVKELIVLFNKFPKAKPECLGFPKNWKSKL